jgi:hypothetical protein
MSRVFPGTLLFFIVSFSSSNGCQKVDTRSKGKLSGANKILGGTAMMLVGLSFTA